jgi:hypothetical protein
MKAVSISFEKLTQFLRKSTTGELPEDFEVVAATVKPERGRVVLVVHSNKFPALHEGDELEEMWQFLPRFAT